MTGRGVEQVVGGVTVIDDSFNGNPASVAAALQSLQARSMTGGRRIAVLGDMSLSPEARKTLAGITTATITTVLLKKGLRNVWMRGARPLRPGLPRLVGPAFTLRFVPAREDLATPESWSSPISTRTAIEAMPEGCIAVVDAMICPQLNTSPLISVVVMPTGSTS